MNQAGRYDYSNPATLFTLKRDIGVFQLTVITIVWISLPKSLENGAASKVKSLY